MKKFVSLGWFMITLCLCSACAAVWTKPLVATSQTMEVNELGQIRVVPSTEVWRPLTPSEKRAVDHPGQEIPINPRWVNGRRVDFFHYVCVQKTDRVVVWTSATLKTIDKSVEINERLFLAADKISISLAMIFVTIGLLIRRGRAVVHGFAMNLILLSFAASISMLPTSTISGVSALFLSGVMVLFLVDCMAKGNTPTLKKASGFFLIAFYLASLAALFA